MKVCLVMVAAFGLSASLGIGPAHSADHRSSASTSHEARRGCVTIKEFRAIKDDMTIRHVRRKFDTSGRQIFAPRNPGLERYSTRQYRTCSRPKRGALTVDFYNGRVMDKHVLWTRSRRDTPKCVSNKEFRRVKRGMKPRRVHRIFDTAGGYLDGFAGGYARGYDRCRGRHVVVTYVSSPPRFIPRVYDKRKTFVPHR
ncbi:hypothetical protein MU582_06025 [Nocardioidaceae bacterium SCSIO 66511]|nr:hypothetical protein MU582_06025 [Nocardioidaceae bacterium SCSIO 66511]